MVETLRGRAPGRSAASVVPMITEEVLVESSNTCHDFSYRRECEHAKNENEAISQRRGSLMSALTVKRMAGVVGPDGMSHVLIIGTKAVGPRLLI